MKEPDRKSNPRTPIAPHGYEEFLYGLKQRIQQARLQAVLAVNRELILLYWNIGREILSRQNQEGWGAKVIERLASDLYAAFPKMKGFSRTNLLYMRAFAEAWPEESIVQQLVGQIPWGHNVRILDLVKTPAEREWYIRQTIENGWSRNVLVHQVESGLYVRQGKAISNFQRTLPAPQSDLAQQLLKDPYNFDFLTLSSEAREKDLETALLEQIRKFLLELGVGFAFVGSQHPLEVGGEDFRIDLLFYHLKLRCTVLSCFPPYYGVSGGKRCRCPLLSIAVKNTACRDRHAGRGTISWPRPTEETVEGSPPAGVTGTGSARRVCCGWPRRSRLFSLQRKLSSRLRWMMTKWRMAARDAPETRLSSPAGSFPRAARALDSLVPIAQKIGLIPLARSSHDPGSTTSGTEPYHLSELKIAQDPSHPAHLLPPAVPATSRVLSVGCGAGQILLTAYPQQLTFGIDIDLAALHLGRTLTQDVAFACAQAEALPFGSGEFDVVLARVSLPYTEIRPSLREMRRVLKPGGLLWMTLHSVAIPWKQAQASGWKGKLFFAYVLLNSALFHVCQRQFSYFGKYESFQTESGMRRALQGSGFSDIAMERNRHFLVTARAVP